eukprot:gene12934-17341_t
MKSGTKKKAGRTPTNASNNKPSNIVTSAMTPEQEAMILAKQQQERIDKSAIKLQCLVRKFVARRRVRRIASNVWQRVFDPVTGRYFWYNSLHGHSTWIQPLFIDMYSVSDAVAALHLQRLVRGFVARMRVRKIANQFYTRFYDAKSKSFYWMNNANQKTTWKVSGWLQRQEIAMPQEDNILYESHKKIAELEELLKEKEKELKKVRKQRFEELEPLVLRDKVKNAKSLKRSVHMDEWTLEDIVAWFIELKMEEYIPQLTANRVDGMLFVNSYEEEWEELGIKNKLHIRKLNLILKSYRIRYQRKKQKEEVNEDEDLLSEYAPSELSALLAAEDVNDQQDDEDTVDNSDEESTYSDEDLTIILTEEQKQQLKLDEQNFSVDLKVRGDSTNFPMIGDIVKVKYLCTLTESGKVVMSTKNVIQRPWVEFVLGVDHVIKGFDRAIPHMSVGERSILTFSPEYAYGSQGLPPHIPPNSYLSFDLTLLGFRTRSLWVKPLLQDINTNEKPYQQDAKIAQGMKGNMTGGFLDSTTMI